VVKLDKLGGGNWHFLPMVFEARTERKAIEAAEAFWASEQAKIEALAGRMAMARDARKMRVKEGSA
jgi:hypothetical protein